MARRTPAGDGTPKSSDKTARDAGHAARTSRKRAAANARQADAVPDTDLARDAGHAARTPRKRTSAAAGRAAPAPDRASTDLNGAIAALLRHLAAIQTERQKRFAYARAADAVGALTLPIAGFLLPDGSLRKIANVGPSSERVILEVLRTGSSPTVERALAERGEAGAAALARETEDRQRDPTFLTPAEVAAALKDRTLRGLSRRDYRGDLQMHSTHSDGTQTLEMIIQTGIARGYEYSAVTDHYALPVAHGLSMARVAKQHEEIDRLNAAYAGQFRLLKGIEANILADGLIDLSRDERRRLEIVVAAPHSGLRSSSNQTQRMLKAVRSPGIHILGHPRGRKHGVRPGIEADWPRIFAEAARATIAVEIDGDPRRQDIDHTLARRALDAGCIFALDSDAHATEEWAFAENAIAHARLAGIPSERIINCWPVAFLLEWAASRHE